MLQITQFLGRKQVELLSSNTILSSSTKNELEIYNELNLGLLEYVSVINIYFQDIRAKIEPDIYF